MTHQIILRDAFGTLLTTISNFIRLEYARGENKVGYMFLDLDPSQVDDSIFRLDIRLEPWRQVGANAPYLDGGTVFFLRKWGYAINSSGVEIYRLEARDANYLLTGRNCAYFAGDTKVTITADHADDVMKDIIRTNLGAAATDTARDLSAYLTVAADLTAAPHITKGFSRRQVYDVLMELAEESREQGTYLVFDIVYSSAMMLEFRTYTGQRGTDHGKTSDSPVIVSRETRNFEQPEIHEDHLEEFNYVYAGGQGEGTTRTIRTATLASSVGLSPFNRREKWIDARNTVAADSIQTEANAGLGIYRSRRSLTGRVVDTEGCLYGVHYNYGDIVYASYRNYGYDAHMDVLHVIVEGGKETIDNQIRSEE